MSIFVGIVDCDCLLCVQLDELERKLRTKVDAVRRKMKSANVFTSTIFCIDQSINLPTYDTE